jgi:hypothetical protein
LLSMAGRILRDMLRTADYKGSKALKSCHTEFFTSILCGFPRYKAGRKRFCFLPAFTFPTPSLRGWTMNGDEYGFFCRKQDSGSKTIASQKKIQPYSILLLLYINYYEKRKSYADNIVSSNDIRAKRRRSGDDRRIKIPHLWYFPYQKTAIPLHCYLQNKC